MIDIPFWFFFWLATVLIQAIFHYGLIGRRSHYGYNDEDEIEILTQEVVETEQEANGGGNDQAQETRGRSFEKSSHKNLKFLDQDQIQLSRMSQHDKHDSSFDSENDLPRNSLKVGGPQSPIHVSAYEDSSGLDPADENDYYDYENTSSCEENDNDRDGSKWRYELMKNYYSSSYLDETGLSINDLDASERDNLTLRVVPTPQVEDDIVYENGRIKWAIKKKQPLTSNHEHRALIGSRDTKWVSTGHMTSVRRRIIERYSPRSAGRHVGFALEDEIDDLTRSAQNTIQPLSQ